MNNDKTTSEVADAAQNASAEQLEKNLNDQSPDSTVDDNQAPFIDESLRTDK